MCQRKGIERKKEKNWKREGLNEEIETSEWKKNGCEKGVTTGCSLSDQHIFSSKHSDLFFVRLSSNSKHKFCKFWISEQLV